jgi:hypothetical protein
MRASDRRSDSPALLRTRSNHIYGLQRIHPAQNLTSSRRIQIQFTLKTRYAPRDPKYLLREIGDRRQHHQAGADVSVPAGQRLRHPASDPDSEYQPKFTEVQNLS